ncbi:hypothetical protein MTsPCn9_15230 [Croceitalea sp. MTPC9]|nr:hypothetical protein MTsPCn6_13900 [Croceitalea sp. MTPC6]GMN16587.1 hypothetical protein MTsPCn9_15230 [Croceitalea sp. MTPC9]
MFIENRSTCKIFAGENEEKGNHYKNKETKRELILVLLYFCLKKYSMGY